MRQFLCRLFHVLGKDIQIAEHVICSNLLRKTVQINILLRKTIALNEIQCHDLAIVASKSFVENKHLQRNTMFKSQAKTLTYFTQSLEHKEYTRLT